jgi:hypothetical protein
LFLLNLKDSRRRKHEMPKLHKLSSNIELPKGLKIKQGEHLSSRRLKNMRPSTKQPTKRKLPQEEVQN